MTKKEIDEVVLEKVLVNNSKFYVHLQLNNLTKKMAKERGIVLKEV